MQQIKTKYDSDHGKHRYELVTEPKKQCNTNFKHKNLAIKVIMSCRTTSAYKLRIRLRLKRYDVFLTKEQSVLSKIMNSFEEEKNANTI